MPCFGFILPPYKLASPQQSPAPASTAPASSSPSASPPPTPTPVAKDHALGRPTASSTPNHGVPATPDAAVNELRAPAEAAPFKFMSRADIAAAATRARMAEIMGPPRRRVDQPVGGQWYLMTDSTTVKEDVEMEDGGIEKKAEEEKGDVEMTLLN